MALQIRAQVNGRPVAPARLPLERLAEDRVQVAAQCTDLRLAASGFGGRPARRFHVAMSHRYHVGDGADGVGVGRLTREQTVSQRAETENIRRHRDGVVGELLRRGIARGEQPAHAHGRRLVGRGVAQRGRDPEVDQLRYAVGGDQYVRRLDIAVHDQHGVSGRDRVRELNQQRHDFARRQGAFGAILIDGFAAHELDGDPGAPVLDVGIDQPRDRGMLQSGEQLGLAREAPPGRGIQRARDQLHRDGLLHAVGALGPVDHPHAAGADARDQAKPSDRGSFQRILGPESVARAGCACSILDSLRNPGRREPRRAAPRPIRTAARGVRARGCFEVQRLREEPVGQGTIDQDWHGGSV